MTLNLRLTSFALIIQTTISPPSSFTTASSPPGSVEDVEKCISWQYDHGQDMK